MRRLFKLFAASLMWRYTHWVCSVDGHKPTNNVCLNCGDRIEELDPVRRARIHRKELRRQARLLLREVK